METEFMPAIIGRTYGLKDSILQNSIELRVFSNFKSAESSIMTALFRGFENTIKNDEDSFDEQQEITEKVNPIS
jgi:hypothetical protein